MNKYIAGLEEAPCAMLLGSFFVAGFWHGFTWPVVFGLIATLLVYYRADFLPKETQPGAASVKLEAQVKVLEDKVSALSVALAFKQSGRKPEEAARG